MAWLNDSPNHPLRIITADGKTVGQFYNSWDKTYHLAEYEPYELPPRIYLCGNTGNFSPSRKEDDRNKCPNCWTRYILEIQTMKANFHLITETDEEVLACTRFIEDILLKRKSRGTIESGVPDTRLPTRQSAAILPPAESKPWFAPDDGDEPPMTPEPKHTLGDTNHERKNVSPGEPSIVKIGSNTKEHILERLAAGFGIEDKYEEHAKLLWSRGEIKFDGDEYYVD